MLPNSVPPAASRIIRFLHLPDASYIRIATSPTRSLLGQTHHPLRLPVLRRRNAEVGRPLRDLPRMEHRRTRDHRASSRCVSQSPRGPNRELRRATRRRRPTSPRASPPPTPAPPRLAKSGKRVLYITGEEAIEQVRLRARRLGVADCPIE